MEDKNKDMTGKYLIVTGGYLSVSFAKKYIEENPFEKIIFVDSALNHQKDLGVEPDYIIGDFDSVDPSVLEETEKQYEEERFVRMKPEKDFTDTDIALMFAMEQGAKEIAILGATGSRVDHMIANIHILMKPLSYGISAYLLDEYNKIYLVDSNITLKKENMYGPYISVLPLTEEAVAVFLRGFKYNLSDATLTIGESLGISNEIQDDVALLEVSEGVLIIIEAKD